MDPLVPLLWIAHFALVAVGLPLIARRVPPNPIYGFRVPATLSDERVWYAANAAAGRWLLVAASVSALFAALWMPGHAGPTRAALPLLFLAAAALAAAVASFGSLQRILRG